MMKNTLADHFYQLDRLESARQLVDQAINAQLRGKDVILKRGKYKGRRAQIQNFYSGYGHKSVHILIYRADGRTGFKGRERFIDNHYAEYIDFDDCELV